MSGYFQAVMSEIWISNNATSSSSSTPAPLLTGGGGPSTTLTINNHSSGTVNTTTTSSPSTSTVNPAISSSSLTTTSNHPPKGFSSSSIMVDHPHHHPPPPPSSSSNTTSSFLHQQGTVVAVTSLSSSLNTYSPSLSPVVPSSFSSSPRTSGTLGGGPTMVVGGSVYSSSSSYPTNNSSTMTTTTSLNPLMNSAMILEFDIDTSDYERYASSSLSNHHPSSGNNNNGIIPRSSLKNYSKYAGDITVTAFEDILRFLYGFQPRIDNHNAKSLLVTASYFDVPLLMSQVADFIFANLSIDNVIEYLLLVYDKEYGEPGKLIEDASLAYLYRNAIDINPLRLRSLPLAYQKKLLLANELYTPSEYARYKLAITIKQAVRTLIMDDMVQANVPLPSLTPSTISGLSNSMSSNASVSSLPAKDNDVKMVPTITTHSPHTMNNNHRFDRSESSYTRAPSNTRSSVTSPLGTDTSSTPLATNPTYTVRIRDTIPSVSTTPVLPSSSSVTASGSNNNAGMVPPSTPLTIRRLQIDTSSSIINDTNRAVNTSTSSNNNTNTNPVLVNNPVLSNNHHHGLYDLPSASSISSESILHHHSALLTSSSSGLSSMAHDSNFPQPTTITMPAPLSTRSYNSIRRLATFSPASYTSNNTTTIHSQLNNHGTNNSLSRSNPILNGGNNVMVTGQRADNTMDDSEESMDHHVQSIRLNNNEEEEDHTSLLSTAQSIHPSTGPATHYANTRNNDNNSIYHQPIGRGRGRTTTESFAHYPSYGTNNTINNNYPPPTNTESNSRIFRFPSQIDEENTSNNHQSRPRNSSNNGTNGEDITADDVYFSQRRSSNVDMDQEHSDTVTPSPSSSNTLPHPSSRIARVLRETASALWSSSVTMAYPPPPPPPVPSSSSSSVPGITGTNNNNTLTIYDHMVDTDDYSSDDHQSLTYQQSYIPRDSKSMMDEHDNGPSLSHPINNNGGQPPLVSCCNPTIVMDTGYSSRNSLKNTTGTTITTSSNSIGNVNTNLLPDQVLPLSPAGPVPPSSSSGGGMGRTDPSDSILMDQTTMGSSNLHSPSSVILQSVTLRDFYNELEELDTTYTEIFQNIRWIHLSPEEIDNVRKDQEVSSAFLDQAIVDQTLMREKVSIRIDAVCKSNFCVRLAKYYFFLSFCSIIIFTFCIVSSTIVRIS